MQPSTAGVQCPKQAKHLTIWVSPPKQISDMLVKCQLCNQTILKIVASGLLC